jgi:hypothetical protein
VDVHLEAAGERVLGEIKVFRGSDVHLAVEAMTSEERRKLKVALTRLVETAHGIALRREEGQ